MTFHPCSMVTIDGAHCVTIALVRQGEERFVLIVLDPQGRYHVVDQAGDDLSVRLGPISQNDALSAVERILAGHERSVTGDGLAAVAGLLGMQAPQSGGTP